MNQVHNIATSALYLAIPGLAFSFLTTPTVQAVLATLVTAVLSAVTKFITTRFLTRARRRRITRKLNNG